MARKQATLLTPKMKGSLPVKRLSGIGGSSSEGLRLQISQKRGSRSSNKSPLISQKTSIREITAPTPDQPITGKITDFSLKIICCI
jgi:hypothetical protein